MDKKTRQQLGDVAKRYPENFGECRVMLGHSWQALDAAWLADGNIERTLVCSRCDAHRVQYLDPEGFIIANRYKHADGYRLVGLGRLGAEGRAVFRRVGVGRLLG